MANSIGFWQSNKLGNYHARFYQGWQAQIMWQEDAWIWETGHDGIIQAHGSEELLDEAMQAAQTALPNGALFERAESGGA